MFKEKEKVKNENKGKGPIPWKFLFMIGIAIVYGIGVRFFFGSPFVDDFQWDIVNLVFMMGVPIGIGVITAIFVPPIGNPPIRGIALSAGISATIIGLITATLMEVWMIMLIASIPLLIIAGIVYLFFTTLAWIILHLFKNREKAKRATPS